MTVRKAPAGEPKQDADDSSSSRDDMEVEGLLALAMRDVASFRSKLVRAEARIAFLEWQLQVLRNGQVLQVVALVRKALKNPRELLFLPARVAKVVLKPAPRPPQPGRQLDKAALRKAEASLNGGEYEDAIARAEKVLADDPVDLGALDLKQSAQWKMGEVSGALATIRRMRLVDESMALALRERELLGRRRELDPRWLPRVAGPPRTYEPDPDVVMHLFKESYPYHVNGFTMRNRYTLQAQRAAGLQPFVVTSMGFPRKEGVAEFEAVETLEDTPHHRLDLGRDYPVKGPVDVILSDTAWLTAAICRDRRPAVIHASAGYRGYETGLVGMALREHLRRPFVYEIRSFHETTWTSDPRRAEFGEHVELRRAAENRCMSEADAVVTIGEGMRAEIIARGIPAERVFLAPNGVDPEIFVPREPNLDTKRRLGLADRSVIGYISNLDHPREGHEVLIEATAKLVAAGRNVSCLIVGDGKRRKLLEDFAKASGAAEAVVFTGRVPHEQIQDMYALIDVFVVPRIDEFAARLVTPLKPFEAMAMARTMVVADLPALVEVVKPGERGLAFVPGDAASLAHAVACLLDAPEQARAFAEEGRRWVMAERTWRANGPRYRAVYEHVLEEWMRHDTATTGAGR